jgi:nickel-dependent lactate racemase
MIYFEEGSEVTSLSHGRMKEALFGVMDQLERPHRVLAVPPDYTRFHSRAGDVTSILYDYYREKLTDVLPALGTHTPMTRSQIDTMYHGIPHDIFRVHDWRRDVLTIGRVPSEFIHKITEGKLDYDWPAQLNKLIYSGGHDIVFSVGQVVPHEVIGMANHNKNLFVGTGGAEGINKSHFLGAVYGMERLMGRADNPVRQLLNYASDHFIRNLHVIYILTVIGRDTGGRLVMRGLFIGDDPEVFLKAASLSAKVNFDILEEPLDKVVVFLDPSEFKSTWLGNKSIYRTRMAIADGGELTVLAPGVKEFGEDPEIDRLIRKYGYHGTPETLKATKENAELENNLSAAAHLIHGSSEGRFSVTYCPGHLTRDEIKSAGFNYASCREMMHRYKPEGLKEGFNTAADGEKFYYISNPALGLWATKTNLKI